MQLGWIGIYLVMFVQTFVLSVLLTPLAGRLGMALGLIDHPAENKIHVRPIPRSGGIAFVASFCLALVFNLALALFAGTAGAGILSDTVSRYLPNIISVLPRLGALLLGAAIIFITGLVDDRFTLRPLQKLAMQIFAVIPLLLTGIRIVIFLPPALGVILTILWIVLLINSFNFLDNMDGLSSGVAVIVFIFLAYLGYQGGEYFMTALLISLAGAVLGFWLFNFYPAKLFMGDCGSMFIGYMVGALTVLSTYYQADQMMTKLPVLIPLIVLGVPIFDTVSVVLIRLKTAHPVMQGDQNHFSHRLVSLGFSQPRAVVFIYLVTICVALNALPLRHLDTAGSLVQFFQIILLFVVIYLLEYVGKKRQSKHFDEDEKQ